VMGGFPLQASTSKLRWDLEMGGRTRTRLLEATRIWKFCAFLTIKIVSKEVVGVCEHLFILRLLSSGMYEGVLISL